MPSRPLREIRASVGSHHATYRYSSESVSEPRWKAVYDDSVARKIDEGGAALSVWRYCTPDRREWFITVMAEDAESVERAERQLEPGGIKLPGPPDPAMVEAFRERRWKTALEHATTTVGKSATTVRTREAMQEAHYGERGARLSRDGRMEPQ